MTEIVYCFLMVFGVILAYSFGKISGYQESSEMFVRNLVEEWNKDDNRDKTESE